MELTFIMKMTLIIGFSYFLGSIPFGYLVSKYLKKVDIREYGSGNIGASNIFRVLGFRYALLVMIGDCLKGFLAVYFAKLFTTASTELYLIAGLFAIIGHNWSIFLKFQGGKGIATTYGIILCLYPYIAIISALIWIILVVSSKFASLGSLVSVLSMLLMSFIFQTSAEFKYFVLVINILALLRHRSNIIRLIKHKENKIISEKPIINKIEK